MAGLRRTGLTRGSSRRCQAGFQTAQGLNIGAFRIGFWGPLCYNYIIIMRNSQNSIGNYLGPYIRVSGLRVEGVPETPNYKLCALNPLRVQGKAGLDSGVRHVRNGLL